MDHNKKIAWFTDGTMGLGAATAVDLARHSGNVAAGRTRSV